MAEKRIVLVSRGMYAHMAIGPVMTQASADKIAAESEERGWTFEGQITLVSFAAFKAHTDST